jgi:hypothetical protein
MSISKCRPLSSYNRTQAKQVRENRNKLYYLTNNLIIMLYKKESHKSLGQENLVNGIY